MLLYSVSHKGYWFSAGAPQGGPFLLPTEYPKVRRCCCGSSNNLLLGSDLLTLWCALYMCGEMSPLSTTFTAQRSMTPTAGWRTPTARRLKHVRRLAAAVVTLVSGSSLSYLTLGVAVVDAQNALSQSVLQRCETRAGFKDLMNELYDYPRYGCPYKRGGR